VALVVVLVVGTAAFYLWQLSGLRAVGGDRPVLGPLVSLGAWVAGTQKVPLRDRKTSFSVSLVGIPMLVAVSFLTPAYALLAVLCGHFAAQLQNRRSPVKVVINCLVCSCAMSLGIAVYDHGLGRSAPASLRGWLIGAAALTLVVFVDLIGVVVAHTVLNWRWRPPPVRETLVHAVLDVVVCTVGGLVAILLISANTWDVLLFAAMVVVADVGWRRTAKAAQRHATIGQLYGFTQDLATVEGGERELVATVLGHARTLLSASRADLLVTFEAPLEDLALRCSLTGDGPVHAEEAVPVNDLGELVAARGALVLSRSSGGEVELIAMQEGFREAVAVPLCCGEPRHGYLLAADRAFAHEGFGPTDLLLMEALAADAAVALRKGGLLEKLRQEAVVREHEAYHDALTGLPNRALFSQRLELVLQPGGAERAAVILIDLDGFKQVNDTLGHQTGDAVLVEIARRLSRTADENTLVARLGGDELVLLLEDPPDIRACLARAGDLLEAISAPMLVCNLDLAVRASVGVAISVPGKTGPSALLRHADIAMYRAKAEGGGVRAYEHLADRSSLRRLTMATELRRALDAGALRLYYQPVVEVSSGQVLGCEALARWSHEQFGPVPPDEFIPVAEKAGLIDPLTWWALGTAVAQVRAWRRIVPGLIMAVNVSASSLLKPRLAERIGAVLGQAGLAPDALKLELTESSMMAELGKRALRELSDLGVQLSIDDFGTGYSSLIRLRHLPFDEVKIDKSFVTQMCRATDDEAVVRSVIELARGLDKTATAEGVEDRDTLERLSRLGCYAAQGYYLARPLPAGECEALLGASSDGASSDGASSDGASSDGASSDGASSDGASSDWPVRAEILDFH
jgi:diguanylate cyclase (GGDEF)-like protein